MFMINVLWRDIGILQLNEYFIDKMHKYIIRFLCKWNKMNTCVLTIWFDNKFRASLCGRCNTTTCCSSRVLCTLNVIEHVTWGPLTELQPRYPIFMSGHCNSLGDRTTVVFVNSRCPLFKWITMTIYNELIQSEYADSSISINHCSAGPST